MRKKWKQILAAGMSAVMLTQPAMTYAADLTENMVVQNASGLEHNDQISIQQENLEIDEQWYADEIIEETEVASGSEEGISDELYTDEDAEQEIILEETELETEDGSEFIVEEETEAEETETSELDSIATYASADDLVYGDYTYTVWNGAVTITGYTGKATDVVVPDEINGYEVTTIGHLAFSGCNNVTAITLPNTLKEIGFCAFKGTQITYIKIPACVTELEHLDYSHVSAFSNCEKLETIEFSDGIKTIPEYGVSYVSSLKKVILPSDLIKISARAFYQDYNLTEIEFPESLQEIKSGAFIGCDSLQHLDLKEGLTSIGEAAFSGCSKITSFVLPNTIKELGPSAFSGTQIEYIKIPAGIIKMGESYHAFSAFSGCEKLKTIEFEEGMKVIPAAAASKITSLKRVILPSSVTEINYRAFCRDTNLTEIEFPESLQKIGEQAFYRCESLENVNFKEGLMTIEDEAFLNCSSITSIVLPNTIKALGACIFAGTQINYIKIPTNVTDIGTGGGWVSPFSDCEKLETIELAEGWKIIPQNIASNVYSVKKVILPSSVTKISAWAFKYDNNLIEIELPESLQEIGAEAFRWCSSLEHIDLNEGLTIIESGAFDNCNSIKKVTLPTTIEKIGGGAFGHTQITDIKIPASVTYMGSKGGSPFVACEKLETVEFEDGLKIIPKYAVSDVYSLKRVTFPESVTVIGEGAFYNDMNLTEINLPKSLQKIDNKAFGGCSLLETIILPYDVTTIGSLAFSECEKLELIQINEKVTEISTDAFYNSPVIVIYGYSGSYAEIYAIANNIPFVSLGESIGDCEYDYSDVLDRWLLDQGTSNSMNYLVHDENFTNSLTVAANDKSFGMRLTEALSNMIYRGMDGWKEIMARETSRKQARDILLALMELQCKQVEELAQVQTAKKYADIYIKTFKQANWAYAIDYGLNSKEIEQLSKVCQQGEIEKFFLDSKYDTIESYLLGKGNFKADSNVLKCIKSFGESEKYLKTLSEGSKWLGRGLKVINTTDKTIKKVYELESLQKTDELYSEMLAYIRDNCSFMAVSQAADDLYGAIHGGYMDEMSYVTSELVNVTEDFVIDEILDAASAVMPYGTLVKGTFDFSAGLANTIFHTGDAQEQADNMRCVAYIGKALASWMNECRLKYLTGSGSEKSDYARRTVYAYYMLLKTRMAGEESLQKNMELSRTSWKRAYTVSKEISATLESNEKWLESSGALKVISTSVVACPVNVEVYDASGNLIVTLADGSETEGYVGDIYYRVSYNPLSDDYDKIIRTPVDGGYTLKCNAVDMGTVDYYLSSLNGDGVSFQKQVNNIPVETGNTVLITDTSGNNTQCKLLEGDHTIKEYDAEEVSGDYVPVSAIQTDNQNIAMNIGERKHIQISILPENASIQEVEWSSNNNQIATVNEDGVIEAVGYGSATITAKAIKENVSVAINVSIAKQEADKPEDPEPEAPKPGETPKEDPANNAGEKEHNWGNWRTVREATVFDTELQERSCGNCGETQQRTVGATLPPILKLNATSVVLKTGQKTTGLKVLEMQKGDSIQSWKSSNTKIVKVTGTGKLTAQKKTGKATVTVTLKSGISKKIKVKVQKGAVKTTKITGLSSRITISKGGQMTLKPILQPFTSVEKVKYSSSNKKIVSVNAKGKIKGIKPGKAKITVKAGKKKFVVTVTVNK